jgi:hypothetical protein
MRMWAPQNCRMQSPGLDAEIVHIGAAATQQGGILNAFQRLPNEARSTVNCMMTSYRGLLGIVELYRFIRSIRGILKLRGGIGKLLPPDFDQLRHCDAHWLPRMMNHDELSVDPRRDDPVRSQRSVNQLPAHGDAGQNRLSGSRTTAGATSRRRVSPASMATSVGRTPTRRSIWSRARPTISLA